MLQTPPDPRKTSAASNWAPLARFIDGEARIGQWAESRKATVFAYEFLRFGIKQGWACLFGAAMVALIVGTHLWYPRGAALSRYDVMFVAALAVQAAMLARKLETWEEAKVILIYHVVGTVMEVFKTDAGSWIYPEPSIFRIAGVPLFSGFMYASIGSYWSVHVLAVAIYINFFAHHYIADIRYLLFAAAALLFARMWIYYKIWRVHRRMPMLLGLGLVSLFIWIAENLGTFTRTWLYPHQMVGWSAVSLGKLGSWFLLLIISYALVAAVDRPAAVDKA